MSTLQVVSLNLPNPAVSFTTSPQGAQYSYVAGVTTYNPIGAYYTAVNTTITFTAAVTFYDAARSVVEYYWDFGDGISGWGSPATHVYKTGVVNKHVQAVLRVTDDLGRQYFNRKQMYLT